MSRARASQFVLSTLTLVAALSALAPSKAEASFPVRWYSPQYDNLDTLRVCYKVRSLKPAPYGLAVAELVYTGGDKLNRQTYGDFGAMPLEMTVAPHQDQDLVYVAYTQNVHACRIAWDLGEYWVLSQDEVSGDR